MEAGKLSVCIIAKNEEQNIERCLRSLKPYPFEIVAVDTGSADRTKEIAEAYADRVYDFTWCEDFAAAKNFAVSKASHPYVMVIDSDEYLDAVDFDGLLEMLSRHPGDVGRIRRVNILTRENEVQEKTEWINRIFPKEQYRYEGQIHEQIEAADGREYRTYQTPVVIRHTGYDLPDEKKREKAYRNISLLKQELKRLEEGNDGEKIPYILYQLGKGYFMAEEYQSACGYFSRGLSFDLNPGLEYVIDMVETYGYALLNSGRPKEALQFEQIYPEFGNTADFQFLMGLIYMNNACFDAAVSEFEKAARQTSCKTSGVNSYAAYYNIGVIYECLGDEAQAKAYYRRCGTYLPANKRLKQWSEDAGENGQNEKQNRKKEL